MSNYKVVEVRSKTEKVADFVIHIEDTARPRYVAIFAVLEEGVAGVGVSVCAKEDLFDIRIGVPLALTRLFKQMKDVNRRKLTKQFFRRWPEAHPKYKTPYEIQRVQDQIKEAAQTRAEAILDAALPKKGLATGRFKVGGNYVLPEGAPHTPQSLHQKELAQDFTHICTTCGDVHLAPR